MPTLKRCLLIALMLVLLPLRGWAGHVMAIDMTAANAVSASLNSQAAMPADCVMHAQAAADETTPVCGSCDTCELCLAVANLTPASWSAHRFVRHLSLPAFNSSFKSAVSASNLKPPIF